MKPATKQVRIHRQVAEMLEIVAISLGQSTSVLASKILAAELERLFPEAMDEAAKKFSATLDIHRKAASILDPQPEIVPEPLPKRKRSTH